jgi:hypothetical protein
MNKHNIEYYDKSEYMPLKVSNDINANVVADPRVKDNKTIGRFVAYPVTKTKPYQHAKQNIRGLNWLQGFNTWMRAAS